MIRIIYFKIHLAVQYGLLLLSFFPYFLLGIIFCIISFVVGGKLLLPYFPKADQSSHFFVGIFFGGYLLSAIVYFTKVLTDIFFFLFLLDFFFNSIFL